MFNNRKLLTILTNGSIFDAWQGSEYDSDVKNTEITLFSPSIIKHHFPQLKSEKIIFKEDEDSLFHFLFLKATFTRSLGK